LAVVLRAVLHAVLVVVLRAVLRAGRVPQLLVLVAAVAPHRWQVLVVWVGVQLVPVGVAGSLRRRRLSLPVLLGLACLRRTPSFRPRRGHHRQVEVVVGLHHWVLLLFRLGCHLRSCFNFLRCVLVLSCVQGPPLLCLKERDSL